MNEKLVRYYSNFVTTRVKYYLDFYDCCEYSCIVIEICFLSIYTMDRLNECKELTLDRFYILNLKILTLKFEIKRNIDKFSFYFK